ncbi:hypothetical protein TNCV_2798661 [Trichonephila clavipes]|nr:hypothetical protein TNCV_2798661 [Trichonephila clavipes]
MSYMVDLQWVILRGRKLGHPVAKLLVVAAIVGFSDTWSVAEENRTGDDKKVMEAEESVHCILNRLRYPGVEMDQFSNSIFHTVVYGQIDLYGEHDDSSSLVVRAMFFRGLLVRFFLFRIIPFNSGNPTSSAKICRAPSVFHQILHISYYSRCC